MSVTRFPKGISTAAANSTLQFFPSPDPLKCHTYFEDFDTYTAGDFTVTTVGAGSAAAIASVDGGAITLTNDAGGTDSTVMTKAGVSFTLATGKEAWGKFRLKVSDSTKSQIMCGLTNAATVPFTLTNITDGIFFHKPAAAKLVDFYVRLNATTGSNKAAGITSMADDTFITFGFYFDGVDKVYYFVNDVKVGHLSGSATYLPDAAITPIIAVINGEAVAKVMTVDYIFASKKR